MTLVPTYTFSGGELSSKLYGRVDLQKYQTGVAKAKNVHVGVEGGLFKRVGQYFVGYPKHQDQDSKFVPWRIANDDSYVLEFGHNYIRFIRLGGYVLYPGGHVPHADSDAVDVDGFLEVPTTYTAAQVRELKFTFANDIVYITHRNHPPRQLRRLGLYDWDLIDSNFDPRLAGPTGVTVQWQWYNKNTVTWIEVLDANDDDFGWYNATRKPISYIVTAIMPDGLETKASIEGTDLGDTGHQRLRMHITWNAVADAKEYIIYKGENGVFGFIGRVVGDPPATTFDDTNFAPSYDRVPPGEFEGFNPDDPNDFAGVSQFYKQRLAYAGTNEDQQKLWFSRPLFFTALDASSPTQANDAIEVKLVGNERHSIQHMVQMKKFIVFTDSAEWVIQTTNNEALAADTIDPVIETSYGSDPFLNPLPVGDRILFVQNMTRVVLDMGYDFATDAYKADDLSRLARHLFENKDIISWDFSLHPNSVVWTVCDDGSLASMTYVREHEIWGWTHHETAGDYVQVACVPEFDQFATYYQVVREINGVLTLITERAEVIHTDRVEDMFFVDCGLTYKNELAYTVGTRHSATSFEFTSAGHGLLVDDEVLVENEAFKTRCLVTAIAGDDVTVKPKYNDNEFPETGEFAEGFFYECVDALAGFDHLAGQSGLIALADGNVVENITVDLAGETTLPFKAARVHLGFPYEAEIITLNLDPQQLSGRYLLKSVDSIRMRLENSRGILAGPSNSVHDPVPLKPRSDENYDDPNRLLNGVYEIDAYSEWGLEAGVRILMPYPLPANILNIIPDMIYEG